MANFGVTEQMVEGMTYGLAIPATSTENGPTSSIVNTLIAQHDAIVSARFYEEGGVSADGLSVTSQGYLLGQRWVLLLVLVDVVRGRTANIDLAESYRQDLRDIETRWGMNPRAVLGASASTAKDATYTHTDFVERASLMDNARDADWFRSSQDGRKL